MVFSVLEACTSPFSHAHTCTDLSVCDKDVQPLFYKWTINPQLEPTESNSLNPTVLNWATLPAIEANRNMPKLTQIFARILIVRWGKPSPMCKALLSVVTVSSGAVGQGAGVHVNQSCCLATVLVSSVVIHCDHLLPGIICRHQLSIGVLHLAVRNKCIWTPDFLQLSLASIVTFVGGKNISN